MSYVTLKGSCRFKSDLRFMSFVHCVKEMDGRKLVVTGGSVASRWYT